VNYQSIINRDIKSHPLTTGTRPALPRPAYLISAGLTAVFAIVLLASNPEPAEATRHASMLPDDRPTFEAPLELPVAASEQLAPLPEAVETETTEPAEQIVNLTIPEPEIEIEAVSDTADWQEVTVKSGDSLAGIFSRLGIPPQQLHAILSEGGAAAKNLKKIYPGQTLRLMTNDQQGLVKLTYPIDALSTLVVSRNGEAFETSTTHRTPERREKNASGIIDSSLFMAAHKAGISDNLTMELAGIFGWDIDFALDIRKGDEFTVLYDELYLDGENIGNGNILAAEFVNHGKRYQAVRYTDASGKTDYYSLDGKSMRKAFLRTPVEFSRISSRFSLGRKHPILNKIRAHKGVDYAASRGTPIKATSNGKIVHRGKKGGYGNTIIIKHGTKYSTLYAHMSKYRGGLKVGSRIKQGQIIGYIGSSGLATGPHLHYEFRLNGTHRDPLRVKLPGADPLNSKYRNDFNSKSEALMAQLELIRDVQVASNN
jgi:murein DD-endopeptidase MepM/ murein hydrolase activator NlpD